VASESWFSSSVFWNFFLESMFGLPSCTVYLCPEFFNCQLLLMVPKLLSPTHLSPKLLTLTSSYSHHVNAHQSQHILIWICEHCPSACFLSCVLFVGEQHKAITSTPIPTIPLPSKLLH
jgi:hypothetical protein